MLLIFYAVTGEPWATEEVVTTHPVIICNDLREAGLVGLLPPSAITKILSILLDKIRSSGCRVEDPKIRAAAQILHSIAADLGVDQGITKSVKDTVQARVEGLFQKVPRVAERSLPLYGVRCGLVYGVLAVQEYKAYEKSVRWLNRGEAAVIGMSAAATGLAATGLSATGLVDSRSAKPHAAIVSSSFDRKRKVLMAGVNEVEGKFWAQSWKQTRASLPATSVKLSSTITTM